MALIDLLKRQVEQKGWLAVAYLYFDNSYSANVFDSGGQVAYSDAEQCVFTMTRLDSTYSDKVSSQFVAMDPGKIEFQSTVTVDRYDDLQHVDFIPYSNLLFYDKQFDKFPVPTLLTPAQLKGMTPDATTGLYPGMDTIVKMDNTEISTFPIYDKTFPYYSGIRIDYWKEWYEQHEKFLTFLNEYLGVTDAK